MYTLSNFKIKCDVTSGRTSCISGEKALNACVYGIAAKNTHFMVTRSELRNLPEVTSRLISKLYKLQLCCQSGCADDEVDVLLNAQCILQRNNMFYSAKAGKLLCFVSVQ